MSTLDNFFSLTPEKVFNAAEISLDLVKKGRQPLGVLYPLNSIENRVYEIPLEDKTSIVGKFYRPERWSRAQIQEEHDVLFELEKNEVPTVCPLHFLECKTNNKDYEIQAGASIGKLDQNIHFCFYPKVQGRSKDELNNIELEVLARFMGRMHRVMKGMNSKKSCRLELNFENYFDKPLHFLNTKGFLKDPFLSRIQTLVTQIKNHIGPMLSDVETQRVHGDCHWGNLLWFQGQPLFLDFDDLVIGPVVQDLWMIVGGRQVEDERQRDLFIENYNQFSSFPTEQLALVEGLRAMRIVHYSNWIAKRWEDPSFPKMFPHFASVEWWNEEATVLYEITEILSGTHHR